MVSITNIFFEGFIYEVLQLFVKTHEAKITNYKENFTAEMQRRKLIKEKFSPPPRLCGKII